MVLKDSASESGSVIINDRKAIHAWAMYDWPNSAYALVIVSAIFPAYYNEITSVGGNTKLHFFGWSIENTAAYSINLGLAFGLVALFSPWLSSISDYSNNQRYLFLHHHRTRVRCIQTDQDRCGYEEVSHESKMGGWIVYENQCGIPYTAINERFL